MEEDYDGPQDLESTVQEIDALYEEVIPPLQETLRVIQGATATVAAPVGNNSVLLRLLAMFRLQLSATNVLVFGDREGQDHTGLDAIYAAYMEFSERVMTLETALTYFDDNMPVSGDIDTTGRSEFYDRPASDSAHIARFHRLLGVGEMGLRMLMSFVASTSLIDDTVFMSGATEGMNLHFLTMQSTRFRQYGKFSTLQMVELYVASMLVMENLKVYGDWIYEQYHIVEERPIVWYNPDTDTVEYVCAVCGRPESEHKYAEQHITEDRKSIWKLQPPMQRTGHAFKRMTRPLQNQPKVFTGTYRRKMTIEEYLRLVTNRNRHFSMWRKRTECDHKKIVENIRKSLEENPTHKTMAARSYRDGQMNCKTGTFYPNRCNCYRFMNNDACGYQIDSLDEINIGAADRFEVNPEVVPVTVPDNGCPRTCTRCKATPRPFQCAPVMFHDAYMDMPVNHYKMAGEWHNDFSCVIAEWEEAVVTEYIAVMEYDDVMSLLHEEHRLEETDAWRDDAVAVILNSKDEDDCFVYREDMMDRIKSAMGEPFYTRISNRLKEAPLHRAFICSECGLHFLHPNHTPECVPEPCTNGDFHTCKANRGTDANPVACGKSLDDPIHQPKCRARIRGNIYANMVYNIDGLCFRCGQPYEGCTCPHTGIEGGFFPYLMTKDAKRELRTPHETIFLNNIQEIPQSVYNFVLAFQGRALGEYAGTGKDELDGLVLFYGPKRTGKSKFIEDFAEHFPEDERGEISDNAEEQWWSAHLVHPMNKQETVKLFTCCELSDQCKIPMTEWQILCDQKLMTIHAKFQTARRVQIRCTVFIASNFMPFKGAMSRRSASVYLKHTIPEQFIDTTLPIRMRDTRAVHQYRAVLEYLDLVQGRKPQLNAVWPAYFKEQQKIMEVQSQPILAFLKDLENNTPTCWRVQPSDTAIMRKARMLNYVPLSRLKRFFQKWCSDQGIHSHKWDHLQWREAKDMFKLKEKNKSLPWKKYTGDLETLKRDYVFGILDPSQAWNGGGQPGAGETVEDVMGNDSESDEEDVDVSEAICINGMSLGEARESQDVDGVFSGINGALPPEELHFLFTEVVARRQTLAPDSEEYRSRVVRALVGMMRDARVEGDVLQFVDNENRPQRGKRRRGVGVSMTQ